MQGFKGNISRVQVFNTIEEQQIFKEQILYIENYPIKEQNSEYVWIEFNYQKCFPLTIFIQGLKHHYLRVYDGQIFILAKEIFYHLKDIQRRNCIHGNLESKNIIVEIEQDSQTFVTYARKVEIKKVYFTNYEFQQKPQSNDFEQIKKIIQELFSFINNKELKQKFSQEILKDKSQEELEILIKEQIWQLDNNQKFQNLDFEDSIKSYRYLYCNSYAKEFDLDKILSEFRNQIDEPIKQKRQGNSGQNQEEVEIILTENTISQIKIIQKDEKILELVNNENNGQNQNDKNNDNNGLNQNDKNNEQKLIQSLQQLIGQAKSNLNDQIIQLYLNRFYEEAVCYIMKDIGEYQKSNSYYQKYSLNISTDSINKSFNIQLNCFGVLMDKIQNLERIFTEIANDLIAKHFQAFKFQIDLNPEEIFQLNNTQILKYIIQNKFIEKESNYLYNHDFKEFENTQYNIIKDLMQELINLLQQIEILNFL